MLIFNNYIDLLKTRFKPETVNRNIDIFESIIESNITQTALAKKYNISNSRVRQIFYKSKAIVQNGLRNKKISKSSFFIDKKAFIKYFTYQDDI